MDIHCPTCGEPWDMHHMLQDEPHEWGNSLLQTQRVIEEGGFAGINDEARKNAEACGWQFANSLLSFTRCPSCPKEEEGILHRIVAEQRRQRTQALAQMLDDDPDGLAVALSDLNGGAS